jgi:hypothetical protein
MDRNIGVLSFGTRCIARTAKIDAVSGDERPILPRLMLGLSYRSREEDSANTLSDSPEAGRGTNPKGDRET